jgi:hypothetical protein
MMMFMTDDIMMTFMTDNIYDIYTGQRRKMGETYCASSFGSASCMYACVCVSV